MKQHEKINYVEFPASDLEATRSFFKREFNWHFEDYGPEYSSFSGQGLDGGFYQSDRCSCTDEGGALVVFYSNDLDSTQAQIENAGGKITKAIFSFPGGRRFHFTEPSGNELAVWSDGGDLS